MKPIKTNSSQKKLLKNIIKIAVLIIGFSLLSRLAHHYDLQAILDTPHYSLHFGHYSITAYQLLRVIVDFSILFITTNIINRFIANRIMSITSLTITTQTILSKSIQSVVFVLALMVCLDILGVSLTSLAVLGGALSIGIGFGLKKITSNFFSGLMLLFEKTIKDDDIIQLSDGTIGIVKHTNIRYTLIETYDSREIIIPNEDIIAQKIINFTYSDRVSRIQVDVNVNYGSDLIKTRELLLETVNEHPRCLHNPAPECYLDKYDSDFISFTLYFWIDDIAHKPLQPKSDVLYAIGKKLQAHNIYIYGMPKQ